MINHLMTYQIDSVKFLHINFSEFEVDPIEIIENYIKARRTLQYDNILKAKEYFWNYLENNDALHGFINKKHAKARLALCLLITERDINNELIEYISFFFEVIQYLGYDVKSIPIPKPLLSIYGDSQN